MSRSKNESKYSGSDDRCPTCGARYGDFKTGLQYYDVYLMIDGLNPAVWKYKRRGTVLGLWHQLKKELWERHLEECQPIEDDEVPF